MVTLALYHWQILNPKNKYEFHKAYDEFIIHSDFPITEETLLAFNEVSHRLAGILNYEQNRYKVFLCGDSNTYKYFANKVGKPVTSQGFNLQPLNYIFINASFIEETQARNRSEFKHSILEGNISQIIAHEIVHQLIADKLGYFKMRATESWKLEGFCEYAASQRLKDGNNQYRFCEFAKDYFSGKYNGVVGGRQIYVTSLLAVEFLVQENDMSFADLMNTNQTLDEVLSRVRTHCESN